MEILNDEDDNTIIEQSTFNDAYEVLENYEELKKSNISKPKLYKYEKTKVLGTRAEQIRRGALPMIEVPSNMTDELEIAEEELRQRKTPFIIERNVGKKKEYWKIEDLEY